MQVGIGGQVDHFFHVPGQLKAGARLALQLDQLEAVLIRGHVLQVGGGAHTGYVDVGISLHPEGDELVVDAVHHHGVGLHVAQDNTAVALVALARAAGNDAPQHRDVFQQQLAQPDTAGEVQVTGNHGVAQVDAGGGNGHIAVHIAQLIFPRLIDGGAQGAGQHRGHLAPGDVVLGPEGAVGVPVDNPRVGGGGNHGPAPVAELPAVGIAQRLAGAGLQHHVSPQQQGSLLPGEPQVRGRGGAGGAGEIAHIVGDGDIVGIPGVEVHVGKGVDPHLVVAIGPVDHGDELRAADVRVGAQVAVDVPAHDAPGDQLIQVLLGPVSIFRLVPGPGRLNRQGGQPRSRHQAAHQRQGQQPCCPPASYALDGVAFVVFPHGICPFLSAPTGAPAPAQLLALLVFVRVLDVTPGHPRPAQDFRGRPWSWMLNTASRTTISSSLHISTNFPA